MQYQHKLLSITAAGIIFLFAGYIFHIQPLRAQISELHQAEIMLQEKLAAMKTLPQTVSTMKQNHQIINVNMLAAFIQSNGLNINKIKQDKNILRMDFTGNYPQFLTLMNSLKEKPESISLKNISCKWEKDNLQIGMDIFLIGNPVFSHHGISQNQVNPFCSNENIVSWMNQSDESELLSAPLAQIKMQGFLQFGEKSAALLQLPNKMTVMVEVGDVIGVERAVVVAVFPDHILVRLPAGEEEKINLVD